MSLCSKPPTILAELRSYAAAGFTIMDYAKATGNNYDRVRALASRHGIDFCRTLKKSHVNADVLMSTVHELERIDNLDERYEYLLTIFCSMFASTDLDSQLKALGFRPMEIRILNILLSTYPRGLSSDALVACSETASFNSVKAQISRIRANLKRKNIPGTITAIWDKGYSIDEELRSELLKLSTSPM